MAGSGRRRIRKEDGARGNHGKTREKAVVPGRKIEFIGKAACLQPNLNLTLTQSLNLNLTLTLK